MTMVDELDESEVGPEVIVRNPIDWRGLDPRLAAALVQASCSVETVAKDAKSGEGYKYATTAAVVAAARAAMTVGKIAMPLVSYEVRDRWLHGVFILIHESGAASPDIHASIPLATIRDPVKAVGATLSYLRKYLTAAVVGVSWDDPAEDVDAGRSGGQQQRPPQRQQSRPSPQRQAQQPRPDTTKTAGSVELSPAMEAKKMARGFWSRLVAQGAAKGSIIEIATGAKGLVADDLLTSQYYAISLLGRASVLAVQKDLELPTASHGAFLSFMAEHTDFTPTWANGVITPAGAEADAKFPVEKSELEGPPAGNSR